MHDSEQASGGLPAFFEPWEVIVKIDSKMLEIMHAGYVYAGTGFYADGAKLYRPGLGRDHPYPLRSHLYEIGADDMDFGRPMCRFGYNRGDGWSIWRGNVGELGTCIICIKRALKGLPGVEPRETQ